MLCVSHSFMIILFFQLVKFQKMVKKTKTVSVAEKGFDFSDQMSSYYTALRNITKLYENSYEVTHWNSLSCVYKLI